MFLSMRFVLWPIASTASSGSVPVVAIYVPVVGLIVISRLGVPRPTPRHAASPPQWLWSLLYSALTNQPR